MTSNKYAELFVPCEFNDGKPVKESYLDYLAHAFCVMFGGVTTTDAHGRWLSEGKLYAEPVRIFRVDSDSDKLREAFTRIANNVKADLKQEAVYIRFGSVDTELIK